MNRTTIYIFLGAVAYVALGLVLTRVLLKGTSQRFRVRDAVLGAAFMPILFVFLFLFEALEGLWERLLIALDYDPPEEMRAGPVKPEEKRGSGHGG